MRKQRIRQVRSENRRKQILQAALACFSRMGFEETTIEDIRRQSGASSGSIYHHFRSKDELGAAVYLEGLIDYQAGFVEELERTTDARDGLFAIVRYHLGWVADHPDWARYLLTMRRAEFMTTRETDIKGQNKVFLKRVAAWFGPYIQSGTLRDLHAELYSALIFGPCQEFARHWLAGRMRTGVGEAGEQIGRAVWRALSASGETAS
jgi:AcrR family transcriptional regulator